MFFCLFTVGEDVLSKECVLFICVGKFVFIIFGWRRLVNSFVLVRGFFYLLEY